MKIEWNRRYTTIAVYAFLVIMASTIFYGIMDNLAYMRGSIGTIIATLKPFIYGFVLAYILNPIFVFTDDKVLPFIFSTRLSVGARRGLAILITYVFSIGCLGVFFWIVIPQIVYSLGNIAGNVQSYIDALDNLSKWIVEWISVEGLPAEVASALDTSLDNIVASAYRFITATIPHMLDFAMNFTNGIINIVVGIIISIYMFMGKDRFIAQSKKVMYALLPKNNAEFAIELAHESNSIFSGFITGKILDSIIIGGICFAGLSLLNMPYSMLISVIVGVTNVIPYFGPFFGAIPSFILIMTENPLQALIFLLFILVLQQFDGNILGPKILGDSTGLSAFWVIFAIMLFGKLMGFVGMFIGVPVFAVIYSLIKKFVSARLARKGLSVETKDYAVNPEKIN